MNPPPGMKIKQGFFYVLSESLSNIRASISASCATGIFIVWVLSMIDSLRTCVDSLQY